MSLTKIVLMRLNSPAPIEERCQFARDVCSNLAIDLSNKEALLTSWLSQQLSKGEYTKAGELWRTLRFVLELARKKCNSTKTPLLKTTFPNVILKHVDNLANGTNADKEQLSSEVSQCLSSLLLYQPTCYVFQQKPIVLLKILTCFLNIINHYLQSGHQPERLIHESNVQLKQILESPILGSMKVLPIVVRSSISSVLTFSKLVHDNDNGSGKEMSNKLIEWLKSVLCNQNLIQSYKHVLQLEDVHIKRDSIKHLETLMKYIVNNLQRECDISIISTGNLMSIILCGMFEKAPQYSIDLPFQLLKYFSDLTKTNNSEESLAILNQLLDVCAQNVSALNRNGKIPAAVKITWFKEKCSTILKTQHQNQHELLKFFTLLLKINSGALDHELESIWRVSWFNFFPDDWEKLTEFLCLLLKTYSRLNQLPKLFSKFAACIKEFSLVPPNNEILPRPFMVNFAEFVVLMPAGQSLELWKIFFVGCQFSSSWECQALIELFSTLLMHVKLTETYFPTSKQSELQELLKDTTAFLKSAVLNQSQDQNHAILFLCYSVGEVILTLNLFDFGNVTSIKTPEAHCSSDLFDISSLHNYLSAEEWKNYLKNVKTSDERINHNIELLLIQKARYSAITFSSDQEKVQQIISQISSYIFSFIYNQFQQGTLNKSCTTAISWLPLLLPTLDSKNLVKFFKPAVRTILVEDWKDENSLANALMKNNFFSESRSLQTTVLTCIWAEADRMLFCLKRKDAENSLTDNNLVWKYLSKHPQIWQEHSGTNPGDSNELNNQMWQMLFKAALELQQEKQSSKAINVDAALRVVQTLCLFPLEDMEPGNQMRCILGLLQLLYVLNGIRHNCRTELHTLLCQSLINLLNKTSASILAMFFDLRNLLQKLYEMLKTSVNVEEEKWSLAMFDHVVFIFIINSLSLEKIESFATHLDNQNGSCILEMRVLKSLIEKLQLLLKRSASSSNHSESYLTCEKLTSVLVDNLSKHLLSKSELQENLIWSCLTCVISYHCQNRPDNEQTHKRKIKKILKHHASVIGLLLSHKSFVDADSTKSFYELVGVLCENMVQFEKYLPQNFLLGIWDLILDNMKTDMFNSPESNVRNQQSSIAFLIKSMTKPELEAALICLTDCCNDMITSCDASNIVRYIPLWTILIDVDFGGETPSTIRTGLEGFLNLLLPFLVQALNKRQQICEEALPIMEFVSDTLKKHKLPLRHSQAVMCFQTCSSLKLSSLEPTKVVPVCGVLLTVYKTLLTRTSKIILHSVAPFLSSLAVILKHLVRAGNRSVFQGFNDRLKKSLVLCAEDFNKLLGLMSNYKKEFGKQAGFLIADYILEVQNVTVDPLVKEQILLGIFKLLDLSGDHVTATLQISLPSGGREILKQLRIDFNQHYRYKGRV